MKNYRDLEIYKMSYDLAIKLHKISLRLPQYEMYEEGSQLRRSSKGVASCIVEGYGRKKYKADFIKFLTYSHASCDETILHLNFIKDTHELDKKELQLFLNAYDELGSKINRFIQYVENKWNEPETRNA
ncbi:MAG: four helix bundle protein [Nitrospirae bacterium RBG_19FT_COMBO_42_15]|nr:MAG: four helix bundle protein [Nitrospirae bacterium RBG_19FT_COMBO_42_15]